MGNDKKFQIYMAAYLVLRKNNEILLSRRENTGYQDGNFSLVAGHLEENETASDCIIREAKEEANIILHPADLYVSHIMHRRNPWREYIDVYVSTEKWTGDIQNTEPHKCGELNFFPLNALPKNTLPEVLQALSCIKNSIHYSEFGFD